MGTAALGEKEAKRERSYGATYGVDEVAEL